MQPGQSSGTKSGSITTQNLVANGAATTGSAVELDLGGNYNTVGIQVTGTYTGALSVQFSNDGSRWETVAGTVVGNAIELLATGAAAATILSGVVGNYRIRSAGFNKIRVTGLAAMTGAAVVTMVATN